MKSNLRIFDTVDETVQQLAEKIYKKASQAGPGYFHIAISGGSTPLKLFSHLKEQYAVAMPWDKFKVFWVDERCVAPDDPESNYGMAREKLFGHVGIPEDQIHRIKGENEPFEEAERYASVLRENLPELNGFPKPDFVILGMGADGHFASIFPDQKHLIDSNDVCGVATHPNTAQKRISLTGSVINNADDIYFLVTGEKKASAVARVVKERDQHLPASYVDPFHGNVEWYVDESAAQELSYDGV